MEQRIFEFGIIGVFFRKVLIDARKVDALGYKCLVVAAVGVDDRHDKMHAVLLTDQPAVSAVAEAAFFFTHNYPSDALKI